MSYIPGSGVQTAQKTHFAQALRWIVNSVSIWLCLIVASLLTPSIATARSTVEDYPAGVIVVVEFDTNSTQLSENSQWLLSALAERLSDGQYQNRALAVEGHTDTFGSPTFNLKLSHERAVVVSEYLESLLVQPRVRLVATGFGETLPRLDDRHDRAARQANRRVEIRLML